MEPNIILLKEKNHQPRIIYPAKLSFRYKEEIKMFPVLQKLREYTTRRAPFQEILKVVILCEKTEGHKTMSKITNELTA